MEIGVTLSAHQVLPGGIGQMVDQDLLGQSKGAAKSLAA
jgi:hypothetical protein